MSRFAESPVPYLLIGLAIESMLLIVYLQTRRTVLLGAILAVAAIVAGGVLVERVVVTDREAIERTVYELAASIEADDVQAVLTFISPQAKRTKRDAKREMDRYAIELARIISPLQIEFLRQTSPPTARAEFRAIVKAAEGRSGFGGTGRLDFVLTFSKEDGRWLLLGYAYDIVN